ncbi:MAG: glycosyltransferase family 2 protein [Pseudomonadota bacterium]
MTTWRVGAILNESLPDTLRFVAWYLDHGATAITLFFDDPDDAAIPMLRDFSSVTAIPCTVEFWQSLGVDHATPFTKRQNLALTWLYRSTEEEWLLNVDADEFLYVKERSFSHVLACADPGVRTLRFPTAENFNASHDLGAYHFRLQMRRGAMREVYEDYAWLFGPRNRGLVGHWHGKSVTRTGQKEVFLRQHWACDADGERLSSDIVDESEGVFILHFAGTSYAPWRAKVDWRLGTGFSNTMRAAIADARHAEHSEERLKDIHHALFDLTPRQVQRLSNLQRHLRLEIDFGSLIDAYFPNASDVFRNSNHSGTSHSN